MKTAVLLAGCAALVVSACATSSENISAAYTSPIQYMNYDCDQIAMEEQSVVARVTQLGGSINHRATNDKIAVGVGVVLFWPALLMIKGNGEQTAEFARLKGESEALEHAAVFKRCSAGGEMTGAGYRQPMSYGPHPAPVPVAYGAPMRDWGPAPGQPQYYPVAAPTPAAQHGPAEVIGVRVSPNGSVTETTYSPN